MTNKENRENIKLHKELNDFAISVSGFGEISGNLNIDEINRFLNKYVADKKLSDEQIDSSLD